MTRFVLAYTGGSVPESPAEQQAVMDAWTGWFGALGGAVVDGGAPFGLSSTIAGDGPAIDGGASALTGYSIVEAPDLAAAVEMGRGCPILAGGGSVEVYETMAM